MHNSFKMRKVITIVNTKIMLRFNNSKRIVSVASCLLLSQFIVNKHNNSKYNNKFISLCDSNKYSTFTYPANDPSEDRYNVTGSNNNNNSWEIVAIFDGHGGWQVSNFVSKELTTLLLKNLNNINENNEIEIDNIIINTFNSIEAEIVRNVKMSYDMGFGETGKVGSCALVVLRKGNKLIVANCGDCRAVLGSSGSSNNGKVYSACINREHNCRVPLEQLLLQLKHKDENNLVVCKNPHACYVKGRLQLTRSFGDCYLKYPEFNAPPNTHRSSGRHIPPPYTPPYVSHTPDISHLQLTNKDKFLVIGTDGLWDYLPDQEAVDIVNNNKTQVAEKLVTRALEIAADESGMTLTELQALRPGRPRRSRHDDTTAIVMYLNN